VVTTLRAALVVGLLVSAAFVPVRR